MICTCAKSVFQISSLDVVPYLKGNTKFRKWNWNLLNSLSKSVTVFESLTLYLWKILSIYNPLCMHFIWMYWCHVTAYGWYFTLKWIKIEYIMHALKLYLLLTYNQKWMENLSNYWWRFSCSKVVINYALVGTLICNLFFILIDLINNSNIFSTHLLQ